MKVRIVNITEDAEQLMIYIARVSNPSNQDNPEYEKLLNFCIKNEHWSVFEHAHMTIEIETSVAMTTQIIRHRSFTFQQFSQRYADPTQIGFEPIELRRQSDKNRQSSVEPIDADAAEEIQEAWNGILEEIQWLYTKMIESGVAKECARFILPQCTASKIYMTGNIRSWIHYLMLRTQENVQKEHRVIAQAIRRIFIAELPTTARALEWKN